MALKVVLENAQEVGEGLWVAQVPPWDLKALGNPLSSSGTVSIVLLLGSSPPEPTEHLEFEPSAARLLNTGSGARTLLVFGGQTGADGDEEEVATHRFGPGVQHDDAQFLKETEQLPRELGDLGKTLFTTLRREFPGYFQRTSKGRYVNRPDNFWTIKVQPRDRSFRITVRGTPSNFGRVPGLVVKNDRSGYSNFKLSSGRELTGALDVIRKAGRVDRK